MEKIESGWVRNPTFDLGISINDNFQVFKIQLIFIDILITNNENVRSFSIGFGIPLLFAYAFLYQHIK